MKEEDRPQPGKSAEEELNLESEEKTEQPKVEQTTEITEQPKEEKEPDDGMYRSATATQISSGKYSSKKIKGKAPKVKGSVIFPGLLQFVTIPIWLIVSYTQWGQAGISKTQLIWGTVFCIFMAVYSIPTGIGLTISKRWGFMMKLIGGTLALLWFFNRYYMNDGSTSWLYFIFTEIIILTLVLLNTKEYK